VFRYVRIAIVLTVWPAIVSAQAARYLPTIQERWGASDLVCTGTASRPIRTGITKIIDGYERDQLASHVNLELCFKGHQPTSNPITVIGYSPFAERNVQGGIIFSGPPVGFLQRGRNLLFLRRTKERRKWQVSVPVYETAIPLADRRPLYHADPSSSSLSAARFALTQELEAALAQFCYRDISEINRIFELLGAKEGVEELLRFSQRTPLPVQRDIAVALLNHGQLDSEPQVISLLMDGSALAWKRANAAEALGEHGTERALRYLHEVANMQVATDDLQSLRLHAIDSLKRLKGRLHLKSYTDALVP
jgi:hypothetical protein